MQRTRLHLEELEGRNLLSVFTPAQIRHAYGFDQVSFANGKVAADGSGQTIAIIEAYHDPKIASDLHYFDWIFSLPDPPKFTQVNQHGGAVFPATSPIWALETAMDVEWAHAIAPRANILLIEADSVNWSDLLAAVNYARYQPGVVAVSMSWGSVEFPFEATYDAYFTTPVGHIGGSGLPGSITFVASSGDSGAGTSYPAVSPNVLAVGGTTLTVGPWGNYVSEKAWSQSSGGISLYESKPAFQLGLAGGKRSTPDVALNGDPSTGYYIYDTVTYAGITGWFQNGGTSAGAPQWAALIALADQGRALMGRGSLGNAQALIYRLPANDFHDITKGSNGYVAGVGYDLVTGRGTPNAKLVVRHLIGMGTLTVLSVMAHSAVTNLIPSTQTFLAGTPGITWAPESPTDVRSSRFPEQTFLITFSQKNLLSKQEVEESSSKESDAEKSLVWKRSFVDSDGIWTAFFFDDQQIPWLYS
ncbi:MAG TPA: S53 family peptidase [Gemmataceae bacterium]|jgi:subtilase family serine protease|nr:S53 family peptidase [Gemmataceae bacterium]